MDDKKHLKKRKKFATRLKEIKGISTTEIATANIVLCNVGQATGLQKETVYNIVKNSFCDMSLPKYIAEKGESYSFLAFQSAYDSKLFLEHHNGRTKLSKDGPPIHMLYVESVPNTDQIFPNIMPNGLKLCENFISLEEEYLFIKLFDWVENETETSKLKNRQVKHYGYEFRYGSNDVDLNCPLVEKIPKECDVLWLRLQNFGIDISTPPDQLTINKYSPGQGIPSHVDKHSPFSDTILSLSLGSAVVMDWKHYSGIYISIIVPNRSVLVMTGEARYDWQHGIQSRSWDPVIATKEIETENGEKQTVKVVTNDTVERGTRISMTFRWTRSGPCECTYKTLCDSTSKTTEDIEDDVAANLEEMHVHQVYEKIAGHFSSTRFKPWPKVVDFMAKVPTGAVVLDLGCGNGKNILMRNDILQIAGERSAGLLQECKGYVGSIPGADCVRIDLLNTGFKDECADFIICIAVIHHFSSKMRRLQAISSICRLLRPEAKALITVWAKDQSKSNYLCKTKLENEANGEVLSVAGITLPVHENRTQFQHADLLVPWKLRAVKDNKMADQPQSTLLRYYHVFEENELATLCQQIPGLTIESSFYEEGNWCVICKKI